MLIRILNFWGGTCWFTGSPLDILDVFECQFRFFILRMRLNDSKGILWAQFGSHDLCYPEASRKRVRSGLCARCFVDMCCQEREFFLFRFVLIRHKRNSFLDINCNSIIPCLWIQTIKKKKCCVVSTHYWHDGILKCNKHAGCSHW